MNRILLAKQLRSNPVEDHPTGSATSFRIRLNNDFAFVTYEKTGNKYNLVHSSIPQDYQGQGLGHILAERVFDHLVGQGQHFTPTCEFLAQVLEKNQEKYREFTC